MMKNIVIVLFILLGLASGLFAGEAKPVKPSPKDKCPVCGMFAAKYPDFIAQIIFRDGSYHVFDGVKDMFRYYFNMKKYDHSRTRQDIASMYVTEYYNLRPVSASSAYYVIGSDVYGPMGKELIPFEKEDDAKGFMKDHKGNAVFRFNDIKESVLKRLE